MNVVELATADQSSGPTGWIVVALAALLFIWLAASGRRSRTCERHGHAPDPDTIGTWNERCRRCGGRIR